MATHFRSAMLCVPPAVNALRPGEGARPGLREVARPASSSPTPVGAVRPDVRSADLDGKWWGQRSAWRASPQSSAKWHGPGATRGRRRRRVVLPHPRGRGDVGLLALLGLLQLETFTSARLVDDEIQMTINGELLIIRACADGYEIHRASGAGVPSICRNVREIMMQIRGQRLKR